MKWPIALLTLVICLQAGADSESEFKNLQVLPADIETEELQGIMKGWSVALGFRCDQCHFSPTGEFEDLQFELDKKETKKTAREMFQMMTRLNETFFSDRETKLSCYTCHHGTSDPRPIGEILATSFEQGGVDRVSETYTKLRKKYYGYGAYNFGPWVGLTPLAHQLAEQEKFDDAKALHELNLEHNPGYDGSHFALGAHYLTIAPDEAKVRHHMEKAMEGNDYWTPLRLLDLAANLQEEDQPAVAITTLRLLTEVASDVAEGHYQLGRALAGAGDAQGADAAYRLALEKDPEHESAKAALQEE